MPDPEGARLTTRLADVLASYPRDLTAGWSVGQVAASADGLDLFLAGSADSSGSFEGCDVLPRLAQDQAMAAHRA